MLAFLTNPNVVLANYALLIIAQRCLANNSRYPFRFAANFASLYSSCFQSLSTPSDACQKIDKRFIMSMMLDEHQKGLDEGKGDAIFASRHPVTHAVFVDNDNTDIDAVRKDFTTRNERLTLLYYLYTND